MSKLTQSTTGRNTGNEGATFQQKLRIMLTVITKHTHHQKMAFTAKCGSDKLCKLE